MTRPLLLDLFCGAGGAGMGYALAGFDVIGVDVDPQPDYPFAFLQMDALALLRSDRWNRFDEIHASPPCQASTTLTTGTNRGKVEHVNLIPETRDLLEATSLPYVVENVQGSELRRDLTLCGEMFGLEVIRHRYFELGRWTATQPPHIKHRGRVKGWRHGVLHDGPYYAVYGDGGSRGTVAEWQRAMGIDWMHRQHDLAEAIPPAYTQFIGEHLLARL